MGKSVVILQPQYFPWIGVFEQIKLADIYVHYDDVQYTKGQNFLNRVQIKTDKGQQWITLPITGKGKCNINEASIDNSKNWKHQHREFLKQSYRRSPYLDDMLNIVGEVFDADYDNLADLNIKALELISGYFEFDTKFIKSSDLQISGQSTQRVVDICQELNAKKYITGLGARNYIDYQKFEEKNIKLHYMSYKKEPYNQLNGDFIPYVTILDLIANCGKEGGKHICSGSEYWKEINNIGEL